MPSTKKIYLQTKDYFLTKEVFNLIYDEPNDMLITEPQPQNLAKYYESNEYISHRNTPSSLIDHIYFLIKNYSLRQKLKKLNKYQKTKNTLLDIGCGTGDFLLKAKNNGWNCTGVEPSDKSRTYALDKDLYIVKNINDIKNSKFDAITLWHVLEHLPDLQQQILKISNLLTTNGTLLIAVPNYKSYDAFYYKKHWAAYDTPRHLWHFSETSISKLFEKHDLHVIETLPMYFDSFYVSMLSEKYKHGKTNYFRAFDIGLRSNLKARKSKQYSSLIYVLKNTKYLK